MFYSLGQGYSTQPYWEVSFCQANYKVYWIPFYVVNDCRPGTASIVRFLLRHNRQNPSLFFANRPACEINGLNEEILYLIMFITLPRRQAQPFYVMAHIHSPILLRTIGSLPLAYKYSILAGFFLP